MTDITINTPDNNDVNLEVSKTNDLTLDVSVGNQITLTVDKGIIGPQGLSGFSGASGYSGYSGISPPNAVTNSSTSTDNAIARFDGDTGKIIQNSLVIIDDDGSVNVGTNADIGSNSNINIEGNGAGLNFGYPSLLNIIQKNDNPWAFTIQNDSAPAATKGGLFYVANNGDFYFSVGNTSAPYDYYTNLRLNTDGSLTLVGGASIRNPINSDSLAIGNDAGLISQGDGAIAFGAGAGYDNQGDNAVAIGYGAGYTNQPANSIIINASNLSLDGTNAGLYIDPVRNDTGSTTNGVYYNTTTKELTYGLSATGNVVGPSTSDNNAIARFDGATGKLIKNSSAFLDNNGTVSLNQLVLKNNNTLKDSTFNCVYLGQNNGYSPAAPFLAMPNSLVPKTDDGHFFGTAVGNAGSYIFQLGFSLQIEYGTLEFGGRLLLKDNTTLIVFGTDYNTNYVAIGTYDATDPYWLSTYSRKTTNFGGVLGAMAVNSSGLLVGVGYVQTTYPSADLFVCVSSDTNTWTPYSFSSSNASTYPIESLSSVCYGNSKFVAVGGHTSLDYSQQENLIFTSTDGTTWTQQPSISEPDITINLSQIIFNAGTYVVIGYSYNNITYESYKLNIYSSTDGVTWTDHSFTSIVYPNSITYDFVNNLYIIVGSEYGNGGVGVVYTSPDLSTWMQTSFNVGFNNPIVIASNTGGVFNPVDLILGTQAYNELTMFAGSNNGVDWTRRGGYGQVIGNNSIGIGTGAGYVNQGDSNIAIGYNAGSSNQGSTIYEGSAVAIGTQAGQNNQGDGSIALGKNSGQTTQGQYSVAIGNNTANINQGSYAISIGNNAGDLNQPDNSIILNASGTSLNGTNAGLYVNPVRNDNANVTNAIFYDTTTKELTYAAISGTSGESGYSGFSGIGISGFSGSGISGFSGSGISGYSGSGISGYSGSGISGWSGFSGSGISGYSGSGISGYSGSGISGYSGSGISGYSGSGISGYSGSGISGYSGRSGYSGSGISGYSGQIGQSGYSGSGISGYSGLNGIAQSGISGYSGFSGLGISGFSGASISGYSGFSGSGISGFSGSGISGYSGSGISGYSGSGISGYSGSGISGYSGSGISGYSGSGISGYSGLQGTSSNVFLYQANTTATSGYPTDGHVLWNNATQTSATSINVSHITDNPASIDADIFLALIKQGQTFTLQDRNVSSNYQIWLVNGTPTNTNAGTSTSYWTYPVALTSSSGSGTTNFSNNHNLFLAITAGISGYSGFSGSGISGYSGSGISGYSGSGISGYSGSGISGYSGSGISGFSGSGISGFSGSGISGYSGSGISGFSGSGISGFSGSGISGYSGSGISGYSGSGISGYSGSGISGYSGYSGSGVSGYSGSGISGYSGSGISGYSGSGISGYSGYSGSGISGYSGSGISGYSGSGISGYSGSGISGYSGSGISGYSGSGISGYSGSGISGYSGSGISGYSGSGISGYSGSGISGYSGISGFSGTVGAEMLAANAYTNATTSFTDITGLTKSLTAGTYSFVVELAGQSSSNAGAQFTVNFSGTATVEWIQTAQASGTTLVATSRQTTLNTAGTTCWTTSNTEMYARLFGEIVVTATGTFAVRGLKVTSGTLTVRACSLVIIDQTA